MNDHAKKCQGEKYKNRDSYKNYRMELTGIDRGPLRRVLREAIAIKDNLEGLRTKISVLKNDIEKEIAVKIQLMNSKREFHLPVLGSAQVSSISSQLN